jgi:hypothetical protein
VVPTAAATRHGVFTVFLAELGLDKQDITYHDQRLLGTVDYEGSARRHDLGRKALPHFTVTASGD